MTMRKILGVSVVAIVLVVAGYAMANDDAESEIAAAREALNKAEYELAAKLMHKIYLAERSVESAGNALYWEAFARYRMKRTDELKQAVELLQLQQEEFSDAETAYEGQALLARLYAEMAERGEIEAITKIESMSKEERMREETRIQALHALMRMNPDKAMPILEKIVRDEDGSSLELRQNALFVLCRGDDQRNEDLLIDLARTTTDPEMLSEIVVCLSMKNSDQALETIISLFEESEDTEVAAQALFAIGRHGGDKAFQILAGIARNPNKSNDERAEALFGLAHTGRDDEIIQLATELLGSENDSEIMEAALYSLSRLDGDVPDEVFMDLVDNPNIDDELRGQALFFAARRNDLPLGFLLKVYDKADRADLKMQVCHAIAEMGDDDEYLDALIDIARRETDPEVKQNIMFWIGQSDSEKAADYLLEVISGP